eukprot:UN01566
MYRLGLGQKKQYLIDLHKTMANNMRFAKYPEHTQIQEEENEILRCGAHRDYGTISLICQDSVGGLEIQMPDHSWFEVQNNQSEACLFMNFGLALQILTGDKVPAVVHRVTEPTINNYNNNIIP